MKESTTLLKKFDFVRLPSTLLMEIMEFSREFNLFQVSKDFYLHRNEFWRLLIRSDFYQLITDSDLKQFSPDGWKKIYSILFRFLKIMTPLTEKELKSPKGISDVIMDVDSLKDEKQKKPDQNWVGFILGNLLRWQEFTPKIILSYANRMFYENLRKNPPLVLAWPMLAVTADQIFIHLLKDTNGFQELHKKFYKDCYAGTMRLIFFVTRNPVVAYFLANGYKIINEPEKAIYWFKTALNFGLQNKYQQPLGDTNYRMRALDELTQFQMKTQPSLVAAPLHNDQKTHMRLEMGIFFGQLPDNSGKKILKEFIDFHLKHFGYVTIIGIWHFLQKTEMTPYKTPEMAIDAWMEQMGKATNRMEKRVRAEEIVRCLELRAYTNSLGPLQIKLLPDDKAKLYFKKCATVVKETIPTIHERNPYSKSNCKSRYRCIGSLPVKIKDIAFKGDIDPILENFNKNCLVQGKETISCSWEMVNSTCVKTKESFKSEQVAELRTQFKGYDISFKAASQGKQFLLLDNVDASTFEPDPGQAFRFR